MLLELSKIRANFGNVREKIPQEVILEMSASIRSHGVVLPIVVSGPDSDGYYDLIDGAVRVAGAKDAGFNEIPAILKDQHEIDSLKGLQVAVNINRYQLNEIEEGEAFKYMIEHEGKRVREIARVIGKSQSYVSQRLKLTTADDVVKKAFKDGRISITDFREIAYLDKDIQVLALEEIAGIGGKSIIKSKKTKSKKLKTSKKQESEDIKDHTFTCSYESLKALELTLITKYENSIGRSLTQDEKMGFNGALIVAFKFGFLSLNNSCF